MLAGWLSVTLCRWMSTASSVEAKTFEIDPTENSVEASGGVVVSGARLPSQRVSFVVPSMTATHMPISFCPVCSAVQTASMSSSILALTDFAAADAGSAAANAAARARRSHQAP